MHSDDDTAELLIRELFTWLAIQEHKFDDDIDDIDFDGLEERLQKILAAINQRAEIAQSATDLQQIYAVLDRLNAKIVTRKQEAMAYIQRLNRNASSITRYMKTSLLNKT